MHNSFQIYMLKVHTERGNSPSNEQLMESMPSVSCTLKKQYVHLYTEFSIYQDLVVSKFCLVA